MTIDRPSRRVSRMGSLCAAAMLTGLLQPAAGQNVQTPPPALALLGRAPANAPVAVTALESAEPEAVVPAATPHAADLTLSRGSGRLLQVDMPIQSVIVGDQGIADVKVVSPTLIYVFGAGLGKTDFTLIGQDQRVVASMAVIVAGDLEGANAALRQAHPNSALHYDVVGTRLVLRGSAATMDEAMSAQRILESAAPPEARANEATYAGSQQITLKVRFAEVSRNQVYNLGFDWNAVFGLGDVALGLATGAAVGTAVGAQSGLPLSPYVTPSIGLKNRNVNANLVIEALESRGAVQTIAEPNLTVRNGKTARFRAGGDIPIPIPQQQGTIGIEYRPFGISLEFTPTLIGGNRIAIKVVPEVSQISAQNAVSFAGAVVPSFTTRRVETDVELASGQTFAIAGLFQRDLLKTRDSVPGLGDIPVLNTLFASQQFRRGETELVVLITPYLTEPADTSPHGPDALGGKDAPAPPPPPPPERVGFILE